MKGQIKLILIFLIIGIFICLIPVCFYVLNFQNQRISNDPNDWAIFSNYLTGLLTPFFTLLNILVLVYLTFEVAKRNKSQHTEALAHQRIIHKEQLSNQQIRQFQELKYFAFKDFVKLLSDIKRSVIDFEHPGAKLAFFRLEFVGMSQLNKKMFTTLADTNRINGLAMQIVDLSKLIVELFKTADLKGKDTSDLESKMKLFVEGFDSLLMDMQKELN